jgi:hypothetical protein
MQNTRQAGGAHYRKGRVQPWDLMRSMETSGNAHVDGCRCAIIKYAFRKKGDEHKMIDDLRKAAHYAEEAAQALGEMLAARNQPELPLTGGSMGEGDMPDDTCSICDGGPGNNCACVCPKA